MFNMDGYVFFLTYSETFQAFYGYYQTMENKCISKEDIIGS